MRGTQFAILTLFRKLSSSINDLRSVLIPFSIRRLLIPSWSISNKSGKWTVLSHLGLHFLLGGKLESKYVFPCLAWWFYYSQPSPTHNCLPKAVYTHSMPVKLPLKHYIRNSNTRCCLDPYVYHLIRFHTLLGKHRLTYAQTHTSLSRLYRLESGVVSWTTRTLNFGRPVCMTVKAGMCPDKHGALNQDP